jgi:NitT/TauT family transport system substrate-binding protein
MLHREDRVTMPTAPEIATDADRSSKVGLRGRYRSLPVAVVLLLLAALLAACGSDDSTDGTSGGLFTYRISAYPGLGTVPIKVAAEQGFFSDHGLDVEITEGFDTPTYLAALDRQFDAVMVTSWGAVTAAGAGRTLQGYAGTETWSDSPRTGNAIVTKEPGIESLADLAEANGTLGIAVVNDFRKAEVTAALEGTGYTADDLNLVAAPFADQMGLLEGGKIDAAQSAVGFYEPLLEKGYKVVAQFPQAYISNYGAELPISAIAMFSSPKFVAENTDEVKEFEAAVQEAAEWIAANEEETLTIFAEWVGRDPSTLDDIEVPEFKTAVDEADYAPWIAFLSENGLIEESFDAGDMVAEGAH